MAAALPIFLELFGTAGEREGETRALSFLPFVLLCCARAGRGGRPIKYVDHGGVWRLRMRAAAERTARGARRRGGRGIAGAAARRKEPAGEQKGDECLAYGLCGARYRRDKLETRSARARTAFSAAREKLEQARIPRLAPAGRQKARERERGRGKRRRAAF